MNHRAFLSLQLALLCGWLCLGTQSTSASPSLGSGGLLGAYELILPTPGFENDPRFGQKTLIVYAPSAAHAGPARALLMVLHGTSGSPAASVQQARNARSLWQNLAENEQIVLVAPTASGNSGGWLAPIDSSDRPTDYDHLLAAIRFAESRYNIERDRIYLWGFSSGGHVTLDLGLNRIHPGLNADLFAAYAINAGVMEGLACPPNDTAACRLVAENATVFPLSVLIGDSDPLLTRTVSDYKRLIYAGWSTRIPTYHGSQFSGGHTVLSDHPGWHWQFLGTKVRTSPAAPGATPPKGAKSSTKGVQIGLQ